MKYDYYDLLVNPHLIDDTDTATQTDFAEYHDKVAATFETHKEGSTMATTTDTAIAYGDLSDYGLGKFQKNIDQLAYSASLDWADDEEGTTEYNGHIALVTLYGAKNPTANEIAQYDMTTADTLFLAAQEAAIVETHSSGAVYVDWYTDADKARTAFETIRPNFETPEDWYE